jgi:hypothetical protein
MFDGTKRVVIALAWLSACGPKVDVDDGSGGESFGDDSGSASMTTATSVGTSATTVGTTTTTSATTGPNPTTATVTVTSATTDPTGGDLPNGAMCSEDFECQSAMCYVIGILGGICGECKVDSDCIDGGCTHANPLAMPPTGSFCNQGDYGEDCMSDAVCLDGMQCVVGIDLPGVLTVSTCSQCATDFDCADGWSCEPDVAIGALTAVWRCVAPGTLANGQSCDFEDETGDASCQSGQCAIADLMGLLLVGVCSPCDEDGDCGMGEVCEPPQVDLNTNTLVPGSCF